MKKLTKQVAIASHREMWNWLADETEKRQSKIGKSEYFKSMEIDPWGKDAPNCWDYCCEYNNQREGLHCKFCPIDWDSEMESYMCLTMRFAENYEVDKGSYTQWLYATDWREAALLARKIAELPEREFEEV